ILNEDNLLQKCNSQNTRLINYFQRVDVLRRLLEYMTGQIEGEDNKGGSIETCVSSLNQLLTETVLDKSPEEVKTEMVMASHFAKINIVFFKKSAEVNVYLFTAVQPPDEPRALLRCSPSTICRGMPLATRRDAIHC
ncbi:hypothetical protein BDR03DRAFT_855063, partial [Suillus americanus]